MKELNLGPALGTLLEFRNNRDWAQYHTPKNLSISIAIEAAELMEHFQWKNDHETKEYLETSEYEKVREEIADIASYLLLLSNDLNIDLNEAILDKAKKNEVKYPVEKSKGKNLKYDKL